MQWFGLLINCEVPSLRERKLEVDSCVLTKDKFGDGVLYTTIYENLGLRGLDLSPWSYG